MARNALKIFGVLDILLGLKFIGLQAALFALGYTGFVVYLSLGFIGGIILFVTGFLSLFRIPRNVLIIMASASTGIAAFMTGFFVIRPFTRDLCPNSCDGFYIEIAFGVSSFLAMIINKFFIKEAKESPVLIQQPQSPYTPLNSSYGQHIYQQSYSTFDNVDGNLVPELISDGVE